MTGSKCQGCGTQYEVDVDLCAYCGRAIIKSEAMAKELKAKVKAIKESQEPKPKPDRLIRLIKGVRCPACGSETLDVVHKNGIEFVQCADYKCNFVAEDESQLIEEEVRVSETEILKRQVEAGVISPREHREIWTHKGPGPKVSFDKKKPYSFTSGSIVLDGQEYPTLLSAKVHTSEDNNVVEYLSGKSRIIPGRTRKTISVDFIPGTDVDLQDMMRKEDGLHVLEFSQGNKLIKAKGRISDYNREITPDGMTGTMEFMVQDMEEIDLDQTFEPQQPIQIQFVLKDKTGSHFSLDEDHLSVDVIKNQDGIGLNYTIVRSNGSIVKTNQLIQRSSFTPFNPDQFEVSWEITNPKAGEVTVFLKPNKRIPDHAFRIKSEPKVIERASSNMSFIKFILPEHTLGAKWQLIKKGPKEELHKGEVKELTNYVRCTPGKYGFIISKEGYSTRQVPVEALEGGTVFEINDSHLLEPISTWNDSFDTLGVTTTTNELIGIHNVSDRYGLTPQEVEKLPLESLRVAKNLQEAIKKTETSVNPRGVFIPNNLSPELWDTVNHETSLWGIAPKVYIPQPCEQCGTMETKFEDTDLYHCSLCYQAALDELSLKISV